MKKLLLGFLVALSVVLLSPDGEAAVVAQNDRNIYEIVESSIQVYPGRTTCYMTIYGRYEYRILQKDFVEFYLKGDMWMCRGDSSPARPVQKDSVSGGAFRWLARHGYIKF